MQEDVSGLDIPVDNIMDFVKVFQTLKYSLDNVGTLILMLLVLSIKSSLIQSFTEMMLSGWTVVLNCLVHLYLLWVESNILISDFLIR